MSHELLDLSFQSCLAETTVNKEVVLESQSALRLLCNLLSVMIEGLVCAEACVTLGTIGS
jgi:hypothetical protein